MVDKEQILYFYHLQGVADLFDEYAETFDDHLVNGLRYDMPNLMRRQVDEVVNGLWKEKEETTNEDDNNQQQPQRRLHRFKKCLDLGCGTGLGGVAFRDCCEYLEGVDISRAMIVKARARRPVLYNVAKHCDLQGHLKKNRDASFDLIISVDVVMYVYDLEPLFREVKRVLCPGGIFAVSTESLDDDPHQDGSTTSTKPPLTVMERESGRYAHSREFVLLLASKDNAFQLQSVENVLGRMDEGKEIRSDVFVFRRTT